MNVYQRLEKAYRVACPIVSLSTSDPGAAIKNIISALPECAVITWDCAAGLTPDKKAVGILANMSESPELELSLTSVLVRAASTSHPLPKGTVIVVKNAQRFIGETDVMQAIWNLRDVFKSPKRMLILLGHHVRIPPELENDVVELDEPLPTRSELADAIGAVVTGAGVESDESTIGRSADAAQGLSAFAAEQFAALNLSREGLDVGGVWADKCRKISETPGLSVVSAGASRVAGCYQIKEFLARIAGGKEPPNAIIYVDEIDKGVGGSRGDTSGVSQDQLQNLLTYMQDKRAAGCIFLGPPGAAKSATAKEVGALAGIPTIQLDLGAMKGSLVGESMRGDQEFYWYTKQRGGSSYRVTFSQFYEQYEPTKTYWVDSVNDHGGSQRRRLTNVFRHERQQDFYRVKTKTGKIVVVTEGHELFVKKNGVGGIGVKEKREVSSIVPRRLCNLSVGDKIAVAWRVTREESRCDSVLVYDGFTTHFTEDEACLMGLWVADGSWNGRRVRISVDARDQELIDFVKSFGPCTMYYKKENGLDITINSDRVSNLAYIFCRGTSSSKRIPAFIYGMHETLRCAWLRGMFSGDGWRQGNGVVYGTCAKKLASDVSELLRSVGVHNVVSYNSKSGNRVNVLKRRAASLFQRKVGCLQPHKMAMCAGHQCNFKNGRTINSVLFDPIVSIEKLVSDDPYSYDIEVECTNRFLVDGIVCHNSEARIRESLKVIDSVSGGRTLWLATCNAIANLPVELRRRFKYGTWFFDLPTCAERSDIWDLYCERYSVEFPGGDLLGEELTGAEIESICEIAWRIGCDPEFARQYIVPVAVSAKAQIAELRDSARGRYLSAASPGVYAGPESPEVSAGREIDF